MTLAREEATRVALAYFAEKRVRVDISSVRREVWSGRQLIAVRGSLPDTKVLRDKPWRFTLVLDALTGRVIKDIRPFSDPLLRRRR